MAGALPSPVSATAPATRGSSQDLGASLKDVWSRSGAKYRVRSIVLLSLNVLLFAAVGSFAYWLRTGEVFAPITVGYGADLLRTFQFGEQSTVTLGSLLTQPINVQTVPMQIVIVGLLFATLISIPILMAILYRFWSSLPFILVIGLLAVMPWLAITLLGSCILASVRPFRTRFRFTSALIALVPAVVYLVLAWRGSSDAIVGQVDPVNRIKFVAPWVMAMVAAAGVFAIVLAIARVVDYRPGAITPLLAVMLGVPVGLFEVYVGRDELYYRLLESLDKVYFADVDASKGLRQVVGDAWARQPTPERTARALQEIAEQRWLFSLAPELLQPEGDLAWYQTQVVRRADWFRRHFPSSPYVINALFIKARALDRRLDPVEFRKTKWIRFYDDFPRNSLASRETWRLIVDNSSDTPIRAVAMLRLAQLHARSGEIDRAKGLLIRLLSTFDIGAVDLESANEANLSENPLRLILTPESPQAGLGFSFDRARLQARWLYDLLVKNRDPIYGYDPISGPRSARADVWFGLLDLPPRDEQRIENLRRLKAAFPNCAAEDNVDLEIAKASDELPVKIERLQACLRDFPDRDAAPEALFRLGMAYKSAGSGKRSDETLQKLFDDFPNSVWASEAKPYYPFRAR